MLESDKLAARASGAQAALLYATLVLAAIAAFLILRLIGADLAPATGVAAARGPASGEGEPVFHVLLAMTVVVATARAFGFVFAFLRQPPVVGEMLAGILLGPSLLGQVAPELAAYVLPSSVAPYLAIIAQVGVLLYMFLVGLELEDAHLLTNTRQTVVIAHASIIVPFVLGSTMALAVYSELAPAGVSFTLFALFLGISMSVTAFPVLARILADRRMQATPLGRIAITCAGVGDVTAWCLLALLVSVARADPSRVLVTIAAATVYFAGMVFVVRPLVGRWIREHDSSGLTRQAMSVVCVALLLATLVAETIGVGAIFGAFLLGTIVPAGSRISREMIDHLEDLVVVLFLPAFFAFAGLRTEVGLLSTAGHWMICGLIILIATIGKLGGSVLAARLTGMGWGDSAALGILMNTRGLMELIVLNIGLDLGVITPALFAMLVVMALVTTLATAPLLDLVRPMARSG
jgi:Kef-type K+ transport system membrane component KefB